MPKAVNVLTFISYLLFLATLLFVYSFLPVMVNIKPESYSWSIHKEHFFYGVFAGFLIINIFIWLFVRLLSPMIINEDIKAWVRSIAFVVNCYISFLVGYTGVISNAQHFEQGSYSYLNYLGPILVASWVVGLIYLVMQKNKTS